MSKVLSKRISIFLSIDRKTVNNYFNTHDNSTLYKRQLRFDFEQYGGTPVLGVAKDVPLPLQDVAAAPAG